jgi:hypothetical protein
MFFAQFASNDLITASRATIAGKIGQVPMVGQGVNSYFFEQHPPYGWESQADRHKSLYAQFCPIP